MKNFFKKYKWWILPVLGILMTTAVLAYEFFWKLEPVENPTEKVEIFIPRGSPLNAIIDTLYTNELIESKKGFELWVRARGLETALQAGLFEVPVSANYPQILYTLTHSTPRVINVTIIEGLQSRQIAEILEEHFEFTAGDFLALVNDSAFAQSLGVPGPSLEGFLFPETYKFFMNDGVEKVTRRLVNHFFEVIPDSFSTRAEEMGWTLWDAVTMASIIEGEAIYDSERPTVSSVYHNRIEEGMRLQADPTIQYIIEDGPRRLLNRDLEIDSPYNTYRNRGLPPGPINNPGFESIKAALYPAETEYLYFVARGDGYHTFTKTNREHINAKNEFQKVRRRVYLEQKRKENQN